MTPFGLKIPQRLLGPNQGGRGGGQAGGKDGLGKGATGGDSKGPRGGGGASTGRPVGSTANQSERVSHWEAKNAGGANISQSIDKRVTDFLNYEKPGILPQIADTLLGPWFDIPDPIITKPQTYYDGTWHSKTNVPGVIGGLVGGVAGGPIGSQIGGLLGGQIGEATGIGQINHNPWSGDSLSGLADQNNWGSASGLGGNPGNIGGNNGNHSNGGLLGAVPPSPATPPVGAPTPANPMGTPNLLNIAYQPGGYQPVGGPTPYGVQTYPYQYPSY